MREAFDMMFKMRHSKWVLMAFVVAVIAGSAWGETACPLLTRDYKPDAAKILITSASRSIGEEDLFLYLVAGEKDSLVFAKYEEEKDSAKKKELRKEVENDLEDVAFTEYLAAQGGESVGWDGADDLALRVKMHPIYELVWTDRYVRNNVKIAPEDIEKYYNDHKEDYALPERVVVEYIFLKSPEAITEVERNKTKERLQEVRGELMKGKSFEEAQKISDAAPGAKEEGKTLEIVYGEEPQVLYGAVSGLKVGETSEVIDTKDGFYLLRAKGKREKAYRPLSEVGEEIKNKHLLCRLLRFQYSYELEKLHKEYRPFMDLGNFEHMEDEQVVVQVGDFKLTKRMFWKLYPEVIKPDFRFDIETLFRAGSRMVDLEMIAQDCEKRGLGSDERIARGKQICRAMIVADTVIQRRVAPKLRLTEEEQKTYFEQHAEQFKQEAAKEVYQVWGSLRTEGQRTEPELDFMKKELGQRLNELLKEARTIVNRENKDVGTAQEDKTGGLVARGGRRSAFIDYGKIFKRLTERYRTREFTFSYKSLGYIRMRDYPQIQRALDKVSLGGFSKIDYYENNAIVFFLADQKEPKEVTGEDSARDEGGIPARSRFAEHLLTGRQ
jgi:hypothetical protein